MARPDVLSSSETAAILGVSPARVRRLVQQGVLLADTVGRTLIFDRAHVEEIAHLQPLAAGRPMRPDSAWNAIASASRVDFPDEKALDAWRRKVRRRATFQRFHAHRSILPQLVASPSIVLSGTHAAAHHGIPVDPGSVIVGYVTDANLGQLPPMRALRFDEPWNVEIGVVPSEAWKPGDSLEFADRLTTWLDLEDRQHRAARLMLELVP